MLSFTFRGKNSYKDFGILISKPFSIPVPERRVTYETIPGRHGTLTFDDGTYGDIALTIECAFVNDNYKSQANDIKAWLMGPSDKLILSDEDDKYYLAQVVNKFDITQSIRTFGEFPVVFNCKPFKYSVDDAFYVIFDEIVTRNSLALNPLGSYSYVNGGIINNNISVRQNDINSVVINNKSTIDSLPLFKIYGSGSITLTLNSKDIILSNVSEYVVVDSVLMDSYKDIELKNNDMIGEFPLLISGNNLITWSGTVSKIELQCNETFI